MEERILLSVPYAPGANLLLYNCGYFRLSRIKNIFRSASLISRLVNFIKVSAFIRSWYIMNRTFPWLVTVDIKFTRLHLADSLIAGVFPRGA